MANQGNYLERLSPGKKRYSVSRVAKLPEDTILFRVVAGDFGFYENDNVEIHFYSKFTEELIYSRRIALSDGILSIRTLHFTDGQYRNYISFDFNKFIEIYPESIGPGEYQVVLNVFSDEIGNYYDRTMVIDAITPSRTEVNLKFKGEPDERDLSELKYFITPSISKPYLDGILQNIFLTAHEKNDPTIGVTLANVFSELSIVGEAFDLTRIENLNRTGEIQMLIVSLLEAVFEEIRTNLVSYPRYRISESELRLIIDRVFNKNFTEVRNQLRPDILLT